MKKKNHSLCKLAIFLLPLLLILIPLISCNNILAPVVTVAINDTVGAPGDTVLVPIYTSRVTGLNILSCDVLVTFNDDILNVVKVVAGDIVPSGWSVESHSSPELAITMNGTAPLRGNSTLVNIYFVVSDKASPGDTCTLRLQRCAFNECNVLSALNSGLFGVIQKYYGISGYVRQPNDTPVDNVMMVLSGDSADTVYTDSVGYYEFSLIVGNYTVRPKKSYWEFEPSERGYSPLKVSLTNQNYVGTQIPPITVLLPDTSGAPGDTVVIPINVGDVTGQNIVACDITLSFDASILTALDASLGELPSGWLIQSNSTPGQIVIAMAGTTPLSGSGSLVNIPFVVAQTASSGDTTTIHFADCSFNEGTVPSDTYDGLFTVSTELYSISGYVRESDNTPITNVKMVLSGHVSDTIYTDVSGYYEFSSLATGNYTVTPSKLSWTFEPISRSYTALSANQTDQDYVGTVIVEQYSISGYVRDAASAPIDNVMMVLSGDTTDTVYTDVSGYYEFSSLVTGNYTVTPSKLGWTFEPVSRSYAPLSANQTDQDYVGTVIVEQYSISGYVRDAASTPIDNVMMVLTGDTTDTVYTDVSGYYEFSGLVTGTYMVTPSKLGWTFEPVYRTYVPLSANQTDQDYVGTVIVWQYNISGYVRDAASAPIDNVKMVLSGDASDTVYTDVSGYYEFTNLVTGDYTVTPSKFGWVFEPTHREYVSLNANQTNQNYVGTQIPIATLSIPDTSGTLGDTIIIPIRISDVTGLGIVGCDITLTFDSNILTALSASVGDVVSGGWLINSFPTPGQIVIAMAGTTPLSGSGNLALIPFVVSQTASPGDTTVIQFVRCLLNEGAISCDAHDGLFTVTTVPTYSISGYVRQSDYTPIADAMMVLSEDASDTVYSDVGGYYEFSGLVAGNYTVTPSKLGWTFEPVFRSYAPLSANQANQNYIGTAIPSVDVWIADTSGTPGDTVVIPINVGDVADRGVIACDITIIFNANVLTALDASLGDIVPTNWLIQSYTTPGQIAIAISGTTPLSDSGVLTTIPFVVSETALPGNTSALHFLECLLNEGNVPSYTEDGLFTVIAKRYSISGYVRTSDDVPIENVTMVLSGDFLDTMYTNVIGYYEFDGLLAGNYTVTPSKLTWRFEPNYRVYTPLNSNQIDQNYTGIPIPPVNVWIPDTSGSPPDTVVVPIKIGDVAGRDVVACDITVTYDASVLTALDASLGGAVPAGWSIASYSDVGQITIAMAGTTPLSESGNLAMIPFVISESATDGATSPMHFANCVLNEGNVPVNTDDGVFTVSFMYYSISGYVKKEDDMPLGGVEMIISGDASDTVYTNSSGYYEIDSLFKGAYTFTPHKPGWRFEPTLRNYCPLDEDQVNQNYTGIPLIYDIKGEVKDTLGNPLTNVMLVLTGATSDTQYTDIKGRYKFQDLLYGYYAVTPEKCGWLFEPEYRDYTPLSANIMGQDYTGIPITPVDVWLPDTTKCATGDTVDVPIYIGDVTNLKVTKIDIKLTFDKKNLAALNAYWGDIYLSGWQLESYPSAGQIIITLTGTVPICCGGDIIVKVPFVVDERAIPCQLINVHFEICEFNEGCVPTNPKDGGIKIIPGL
jgi:hypothetical protein